MNTALISASERVTGGGAPVEYLPVLTAIPLPILVLGPDDLPIFANLAAEVFFSRSLAQLAKLPADRLFPPHSPIFQLIAQVRETRAVVSEYGVILSTPHAHFSPI